VIKTIAGCISETFGSTHAVSRIGGEEFAVIIRGGNFKDRFTLAELTRLRIAKLRIDMSGRVLSPTISVGVAEITSERSKNDIFQVADQALYLAKSAGRNRVYHESELSDPSVKLLQSSLLAVS
jgi:diguanylate cyclase (GGDEF)-like protein